MSAERLGAVRVLLCDADGNLFPSEGPAFDASAEVTNRFLASLGVERRFTAGELRSVAEGRNFRATAAALAESFGAELRAADLAAWVEEEKREVTAHLGRVLDPDDAVREPCARLGARFSLAVVSSSATSRLDACFRATRLDELFPPEVRFSAEDSLPAPASKPDPAVYTLAGERLGVSGDEGLAIEDSVAGALSAVGAGFPTVGNVQFVEAAERAGRAAALREAGALAVVSSWAELEALLRESRRPDTPATRSAGVGGA